MVVTLGVLLPGLLLGCADPSRTERPPRTIAGSPPAAAAPAPRAAEQDAAGQAATSAPARPGSPDGPQRVIQRGTGVFLETGPAQPARADAEVTDDGEVTLSFVNADVREVIGIVLGDILGRNYVVSPEVTGTVTIRTEQPIARAAVLDVFERALQLTGATIIERAGLLEVVASEAATRAGANIELGPGARGAGAGFGVDIVPLGFIGASEIQELITPVLSPDAIVQADAERNLLIVAGTRSQRRNVAELAATFDVDWLEGQSVGLFPLEFAEAEAIAEELRAIFAASEGGVLADVVRINPVERLNAILAISTQPSYLDRVETWIERLDQGLGETTPQVFVYYVQNGRAADLAAVLNEIFAPGEAPVQPLGDVAPGRESVELFAPGRADTGFTLGAEGVRGQRGTRSLFEQQASEGARPAQGRTTARSEAQARAQQAPRGREPRERAPATGRAAPRRAAPAAPPGGVTTAQGEPLVPGESEVRIIADETNNALVVLATPPDYRRVEAALRKLDIVPLQVLIEATIAEVTLNDNLEYGLQWFFESGEFEFTLDDATSGLVNPALPGFAAVFDSDNARAVLSAIDSVTDLEVISAPQVLVLDNQTAVLQVGDQVPVAVQQVVGVTDPDAPVVNTVEFRDTGTILLVTPRVNASGLVTLEVEQEVSDAVRTITSGIDSPTIQRRLIQTTVAVESGETLALGGLIRDRNSRTRSGVPLLMDIPILGALFRRTTDDQERSEILVLITPRVVRNTEDARQVTDELRRRLRSLAPLEAKIHAPGAKAAPPPRPRLRPNGTPGTPVPLLRPERR